MTFKILEITIICQLCISCSTSLLQSDDDLSDKVLIPYLKNSANECYFLDDFMPIPASLVSGKYGRLSLRYYTYTMASYKEWKDRQVILSFYSQDDACWSLFEESYIQD